MLKRFSLLHAFKAIERGERVYPLMNFRELITFKYVLAPVRICSGRSRDVVFVFDENFHGVRERILSREVFVHDDAEAEIVHGTGKVLAHHGLFGRAVAGRELSAVFGDAFAELHACINEIRDEDLVIVDVFGVPAQDEILGLEILVHHLIVVKLADRVREVGDARDAGDELLFEIFVVNVLSREQPLMNSIFRYGMWPAIPPPKLCTTPSMFVAR